MREKLFMKTQIKEFLQKKGKKDRSIVCGKYKTVTEHNYILRKSHISTQIKLFKKIRNFFFK